MNRITFFTLCLLACALLLAHPTFAKNNKGKQGHGNSHEIVWDSGSDKDTGKNKKNKSATPGGSDKDILRGYVLGHYKKNCPPGLAKKNPPCIPPGQAKKFDVNSFLPESGWSFIPDEIASLLTPPPKGARYVRMDKNAYLIMEGTRKVIEAIELFSEVH